MNRHPTYQSSHQANRQSNTRPLNRRNYDEDDEDDEYEEQDDVDLGETDEDDEDYTGYQRAVQANYRKRNPNKKQRVEEEFTSAYEFRPRNVNSGRVLHPEWDDRSTHVLLDTWGDRFLQLGRSSLRGDDWAEVADRVSEITGFDFGVADCRTRLNVLKNKYKREKAKAETLGTAGNSRWLYFRKMDVLMTMPPRQQQQCGLACGVDSGEFVFMNTRVYLDKSNALDEMRDSPGNSESEGGDEDVEGREEEDDGVGVVDLEAYRVLSDSIRRVGEIYEKIEDSKRQHMMELERMRVDFQRNMELQKKEMMERTRAEIARLKEAEEEEEDGDCSADTVSE